MLYNTTTNLVVFVFCGSFACEYAMFKALQTFKDISDARKKRTQIINNTKNGETIQKTR